MPILAITSCPSDAVAEKISRALVDEQLAACVTRVPGARSIYRWQGEVEETGEILCLIKTTEERLDEMKSRVVSLHPYEVPELIVLPVIEGLAPYLTWLESAVAKRAL